MASGVAKYDISPDCHLAPGVGVPSISYTMFVERPGAIYLCNDVEAKTWSQGDGSKPGDENEMFLAICFGGNFSGDGYTGSQDPSVEQIAALPKLWQHLKDVLSLKNNGLHGHYDFGKPACPGNILKAMIENIRSVKDWADPVFSFDIGNFMSSTGRQKALQRLGYYTGDLDGIWGSGCRAALSKFQRAVGLTPDGVWGDLTTNAVTAALSKWEHDHAG